MKHNPTTESKSTQNDSSRLFQLNGRVPLLQAVPFGLQHVLAMFVSNIAPIIMFGSIMFAGFGMLAKCGFSNRNMLIVSLSLSVGLGFTQASSMFSIFPPIVQTIFAENCVAIVFLLAVLLNVLLPKEEKLD